jgi:hypothetical protein
MRLLMGISNFITDISLERGIKFRRHFVLIHGITGNVMKNKGQIELSLGDKSHHQLLVKS